MPRDITWLQLSVKKPRRSRLSSPPLPSLQPISCALLASKILRGGYTVDKTVPVAFDYVRGGQTIANGDIHYDKLGRITSFTQDDKDIATVAYVDNADGKWISKTISKWADGKETERTKTERTLDSKGRIIAVDNSKYDFTTEQWAPTHSYAYDYNHMGKDNSVTISGDAVITKDINYQELRPGLTFAQGYECIWFEPKQSYVRSEFEMGYKTEYKLDGNTLTWSKIFSDKETGKVENAEYYKEEVQEGKPQAGYYTLIDSYSTDNQNWTITEKTEFTTNYNDLFTQNDGKQRVYACYTYDTGEQQYNLDRKTVYEWVNHPSLKLIKETEYRGDDDADISYYPVGEDGKLDRSGKIDYYLCQNGDYITCYDVRSEQNDNEYIYYYTFYTAQGKETRQIRISETEETSALAPKLVEELKNGVWTPLKNETILIGDQVNKLTYKTNEKGYPVWSEEYEDGILDEQVDIEYTDKGYNEKTYTISEDTQQKYMEYEHISALLSDGSHELVINEYAEDGAIDYRSKRVYKDDLSFYYSWNESANNWSTDPSVYVASITTKEADGTRTTISRSYENGKIVNDHKTVNRTVSIPAIKMTIPTNPLPGFIPDGIFSSIRLPEASTEENMESYIWNSETNEWELEYSSNPSSYEEEKIEEDGSVIYTVKTGGSTYKYTVSANGILSIYSDYGNAYIFGYDEDARLTQIQINPNNLDDYEIYAIDYGKIQVTVTDGINQPTAQTIRLQVNGRTITLSDANSHAQSGKSLQLFSLDGKLVDKSQAGSVTAPAAGIYIVVADGLKTKISVK